MEVTLSGIVMLSKLSHPVNAPKPMEESDFGGTTSSKETQPAKEPTKD